MTDSNVPPEVPSLPEPPTPPADPSAPTPPPAPAPEPTSFEQDDAVHDEAVQDDAVQDDAEQNLPLPDPGPRDGHHEQDGETPAE